LEGKAELCIGVQVICHCVGVVEVAGIFVVDSDLVGAIGAINALVGRKGDIATHSGGQFVGGLGVQAHIGDYDLVGGGWVGLGEGDAVATDVKGSYG